MYTGSTRRCADCCADLLIWSQHSE